MKILKNEQKYTKIIAGGLMQYFLFKGVQNFQIEISIEKKYIEVTASGMVKLSDKDFKDLEILRNPMCLPEFENYYDTLIDYDDSIDEMANINGLASITDVSDISYDGEQLTIKLRRNF